MNTLILIIGFVVLIKIVYEGLNNVTSILKDIWSCLRRIEDGPRKFY